MKQYHQLLLCLSVLLWTMAVAWSLTLVTAGQSSFVIVGDAKDGAVKDLQMYLQRLLGVTLPIVPLTVDPLPVNAIVTGNREVPGYTPSANIPEQGYQLKVVNGRLVIHGGGALGSQFGIYGLLEDHFQCHWLTDVYEVIPVTPTLTIPDTLDEIQQPSIRDRDWIGGDFYIYSKQGAAWRRRNRIGQSLTGGATHNLYSWLPPHTYYAAHPDWYPLNAAGVRLNDDPGMCVCWTNTVMIAELARVISEYMDKHPATALVPVCQGDGYTACQCANCRKYAQAHGGDAALVINCLNQVLAITKQSHPRHCIVTFAYHGTYAPPTNLAVDANLYVEYVRTGDAMKSITAETNAKMCQQVLGWSALTPNLRVWSWAVGFHCFINPFPNYQAMADDVVWFAPRVSGFRHQGNTGAGADWGEMRAWLDARLMWNAKLDVPALEQQFCQLYAGPLAGPHLWRYLQRVQQRATEVKRPLNAVFDGDPDVVKTALFSPAEMTLDQVEFKAALAEATGEYLAHVRHLWYGGYAHLLFMPAAQFSIVTSANQERWLLANGDSALLDPLQGISDVLKTTYYKEWSAPSLGRDVFLRRIAGGRIAPEVENAQLKLGFCAVMQAGLFSLYDKASAKELLAIGKAGEGFNGGLRDYTGLTLFDPVFTVTANDGLQTIASTANVVNDIWNCDVSVLKQTRLLQLPADRRGFTVTSSLRAYPNIDIYQASGYTSQKAIYAPISKVRWKVWAPATVKLVALGPDFTCGHAFKDGADYTIPLPQTRQAGQQLVVYLINAPGDIVMRVKTDWSGWLTMNYTFDRIRNDIFSTWSGAKKQAPINTDVPLSSYEVDILTAQEADRELAVGRH